MGEVRGLKPTTLASYRWICESYLVPRLGQVQLRKLAPPDAVAFLDRFSKEPGRVVPGARRARSPSPIGSCRWRWRTPCGRALFVRNPAEGAREDLPRGESPAERGVWTLEQFAAFLDSTVSYLLDARWGLAATTGLRRGELCGLRWDDVDLASMSLTVRRCRVMVHGGPDGLNSEDERRATDDRARRVHGRPPR